MIQSTQNQYIKEWRKLNTKKGRQRKQQYIVEGFHLVEEAVKTLDPAEIINVIVREGTPEAWTKMVPRDKLVWVSEEVAESLAETETTQGVFAVLKKPISQQPEALEGPYLLLDSVQDPGNVGTMIRTAVAAGFRGFVLGKGTVDLYNMKTLRAAQGSHFYIDIFEGDLKEWIRAFKASQIPVYGSALDEQAVAYKELFPPKNSFALIMGNEGQGMNEELLLMTDKNLYIPIASGAESLNVAVAAGILMFHLQDNMKK